MKKQHLLFGIASALMLAACDPVEVKESSLPVSSSGMESSTPIVISSKEPVDSAKLLSDFVTNLANKKQTMTFDLGNGEYKAAFVGDGGMSVSFGGVRTFGFIKNSQGWFNYNLIDGQIVLGSLETFDTSVTAYDFFLWGGDIAAYGTDIYTVDSANPRKFHSTNDRLLASLSSFFLDGASFRELSLLIDEYGSGIFSLTYGVSKIYVTFADFGQATSPTLEAF
ncbi:MAG: hypothetical protein J6328_03725, partial [Bacilli bacterium]|nr:hypothetical protein [Bacilli bacterium]